MDVIRKRVLDVPYIQKGILSKHFFSYNPEKEGFKIGDDVLMVQIDRPGVSGKVSLVLNDEIKRIVRITGISTKLFSNLDIQDFKGAAPYLTLENLPLMLALIYNQTIENIVSGEITIVTTENLSN